MRGFVWLLVGAVLITGCSKPEEPAPQNPKPAPKAEKRAGQPGDVEERAYQLRELDVAKIKIDGRSFDAWVMDTDAKRAEGFMWVRDVKPEQMMIFAFPRAESRSFWMKNCYMGLDIAYFGADMRLINVGEGKPHDESGVPSSKPAQFVVEAKVGTFARMGFKAGAKLEIPPTVIAVE